jgi:hypothetical protein
MKLPKPTTRAACMARIEQARKATVPVFDRGFNGEGRSREPVIYSDSRATIFRDESPVHEVQTWKDYARRDFHTGWYTDPDGTSSKDGTGLCWGMIASLSHGRFLAGYEMGGSNARTYFLEVHDTERDACLAADEHARVIAEQERDYQQRWQDARALEDRIKEYQQRLAECLALRNDKRPCFARVREEARECIEAIREAREELATDYAGVL